MITLKELLTEEEINLEFLEVKDFWSHTDDRLIIMASSPYRDTLVFVDYVYTTIRQKDYDDYDAYEHEILCTFHSDILQGLLKEDLIDYEDVEDLL